MDPWPDSNRRPYDPADGPNIPDPFDHAPHRGFEPRTPEPDSGVLPITPTGTSRVSRIRTCDTPLWRRLLWPAELQPHSGLTALSNAESRGIEPLALTGPPPLSRRLEHHCSVPSIATFGRHEPCTGLEPAPDAWKAPVLPLTPTGLVGRHCVTTSWARRDSNSRGRSLQLRRLNQRSVPG